MPWTTPTLRTVRETVRGEITTSLGRASFIGNSVLRVMADAMAALTHLTLRYVDWVALQLMPDTSEREWLDRHGEIWLTNFDGTGGRKLGSFASGTVSIIGIQGTIIPAGTRLMGGDDWPYETTVQATITPSGIPVQVRALSYGVQGNRVQGDALQFETAISGVEGVTEVILIDGGVDSETDEQLRARVLKRIRQPPMGGAAYDYEAWALSIPGVTRAWAVGNEMGMGTVTVRFMMDVLRGDIEDGGSGHNGFPQPQDVAMVADYIDIKRPVTVKDCFVVAPIQQVVNIDITELVPDTEETRVEIEESLEDMFDASGAPGKTMYSAWIANAILSVPNVVSFQLVECDDYPMPSPGHMPVLGTINYV